MRQSLLFLAAVIFVLGAIPVAAQVTIDYGDMSLTGGFQAGHYPHIWDLTAGDLTLSFTYDGNGLVDDFGGGAHAWGEAGVREVCYGDFNPTWMTGGAGVWLTTDYDWAANTFDPDPPGAPIQDIDDKLLLQRGGGMDEAYYDLPSAPPNPWANHAFWFDRDGVDPYQAAMWGAIDGVTYNTGGTYDILITLHADSDTTGTAYMTVNGEPQGFYVPGWHSGPPDLYPAGMAFSGDMAQQQVFYGMYGYGATHSIEFDDIQVTGYLAATTRAWCLQRSIDVRPCSFPNPINRKSKGDLPVALLSSSDFDATTVDPETVTFAGASPVRWVVEDVGGECGANDGYDDLLLFFETQDLVELDSSSTMAYLDGMTYDGLPIWGMDSVVVRH